MKCTVRTLLLILALGIVYAGRSDASEFSLYTILPGADLSGARLPATLYVSSDRKDNNPGTSEAPLKTIRYAGTLAKGGIISNFVVVFIAKQFSLKTYIGLRLGPLPSASITTKMLSLKVLSHLRESRSHKTGISGKQQSILMLLSCSLTTRCSLDHIHQKSINTDTNLTSPMVTTPLQNAIGI